MEVLIRAFDLKDINRAKAWVVCEREVLRTVRFLDDDSNTFWFASFRNQHEAKIFGDMVCEGVNSMDVTNDFLEKF